MHWIAKKAEASCSTVWARLNRLRFHSECVARPSGFACITGYWHVRSLPESEVVALAEPVPDGPSTIRLLEIAKSENLTVGAGLIEKADDGRCFNSFVVAMPDGRIACHRKLHCFISEYLASGDQFTVFDLPNGMKAGILICYDNNIAENARCTALAGAEVLLAPHQTGGCNSRSPHAMKPIDPILWRRREEEPDAIQAEFLGDKGREWLLRWLPARAHDNGMFLLFSNGVGEDAGEVRTGNAMILDPYGRIVSETGKVGDDMVVAELDRALLEASTGRRWMKARRPELYESIVRATGREQDIRQVRFEHD